MIYFLVVYSAGFNQRRKNAVSAEHKILGSVTLLLNTHISTLAIHASKLPTLTSIYIPVFSLEK